MTDVVYILGDGSRHNNDEIRYSLRSLDRWARNVGNVFIVGSDTGFPVENTTFIPHPDAMGMYSKNCIDKIYHAADVVQTERFVIMMDDVFFLREVDMDTLPRYRRPYDLADKPPADANNWHRCIVETRAALDAAGKPIKNYAHHAPIPCTRTLWRSLTPWWTLAMYLPHGLSWMSVLGNCGDCGVEYPDCKIDSALSADEIERRIAGRPHWSIGDGAVNAWEVLRKQFPRTCARFGC